MKIDTLKSDYIFSDYNPMLSIGVRQHLRYISGKSSYVSLMEINPKGYDPETYLQFAKSDLLDKGGRSSINAIGNAKRSVHLLIDSFFELLGLKKIYNRARFPEKLDVIQQLEAFPIRLISNLNKTRNEVEHDYNKVSIKKVKDFVEVAELFYLLCTPFLKRIVNSVHVGLVNDDRDIMWLLNPYNSQVSIHECKNSSSIDSPKGKIYYNYSGESSDIKLLQLIEMKKRNIKEWMPILNSLIFITKKNLLPENPPYNPKDYKRIMCFSNHGTYFDEDSFKSA
jgi:uncharacterized protein with HEPN domain